MKTFARILCGFILLILVGTTALFLFHPRIPLGWITRPVSSLLTVITGSEQKISGSYFVVPGLWTTFSIENGSLCFTGKEDFRLKAYITSSQTTVNLWSLVKKEINLDGFSANGLTLDVNTGGKEEGRGTDKKDNSASATQFMPFTVKQTGNINLEDISTTITNRDPQPKTVFVIEDGRGGFSHSTPVQFTVQAILNGRKFVLDIQGGSPDGLAAPDSEWPISVHLQYRSVVADIRGAVGKAETGSQLTAQCILEGEHVDDLLSIFGTHASRDLPFRLLGTTTVMPEDIRGDFSTVQLGSENLAWSFSVQNYMALNPQYAVSIQGDRLDLDSVQNFFTPGNEGKESKVNKSGKPKITPDDVIIPSSLPNRNLTIDLDLKELIMAGRKAGNVRLTAVMRDGNIGDSSFAATFKNSTVKGHFSLKTDAGTPRLQVHYDANAFNIGAFLREFNLADDIVLHVEKTTTDLRTQGRTLGELLANLVFSIHADKGVYEYEDPNTGAVLPVSLEKTEIVGVPGKKITATLQGKIHTSPISMVMEIEDRRNEPRGSVTNIPLKLDVQVAETKWQLAGKIPLPFNKVGTVLHSRLTGKNLSSLNELLHVALPAIGPYEIAGELSIVPQGYKLEGILVRVGSSVLNGNTLFDTRTSPPEVKIGLKAEQLQLDDFKALQKITGKKPDSDTQLKEEKHLANSGKKNIGLLDQTVIDSYNCSIGLEIKEVVSGADHLGSGTLKIEQQQGRFRVSPLEILLPEGSVHIEFSLGPFEHDRLYTFNMKIDNLDYGFVARHFKPDTDMSGIITLHTELQSVSPDSKGVLPNGSGYLDFCVQPRKLTAGVIDLWAVNLMSYLLPVLAPKEGSIIHCAAGRFNLTDGILKQDEFLIDTSQIRVKGVVKVDFKTQRINARLRPIPKRPQFYSLATPIEIKGNLADIDVGIATGGVIGTIIRLATSYIVVPLQWIIQNKLPEDGTADCLQLVGERSEEEKTLNK